MRWRGDRESEMVEDRRGRGGGMVVKGGIGTVVLAIVVMLLGGDPRQLLGSGQPAGPQQVAANDDGKKFVSVVLADTEDVWSAEFKKMGKTYIKPTLVLFSGQVESACGYASAATGPFYCPADSDVYIDLSFYDELQNRFGAKGEFAQAYVIAHEVGHHVQHLLGTVDGSEKSNDQSVRTELQADFYAGYWARRTQEMEGKFDKQDIEDGLNAAAAIGDDRLQREAQGYVVPESFTHGTSAQRVRWFKKGWDAKSIREGDTFSASRL